MLRRPDMALWEKVEIHVEVPAHTCKGCPLRSFVDMSSVEVEGMGYRDYWFCHLLKIKTCDEYYPRPTECRCKEERGGIHSSTSTG